MNSEASAVAHEWRKLTRAATLVALLTAPAFFLVLYDGERWDLVPAIIVTAIAVLLFRGLVEICVRRLIPWTSLWDAGEGVKEEDLIARRRYWWWRTMWRRIPVLVVFILILLGICQAFFAFAGISVPFFSPFGGLRQIFPIDEILQIGLLLLQLPLFLFFNAAVFIGPMIMLAARGIRSYEPGDAAWGVKLDEVRGQAEAKGEVVRIINLWQAGEAFEKAGGKRERGLLFLGAPGTGKTMISKAIATEFNCPFVTIPGSGFAQMFIGMDALVVQMLTRRARKLARKWGGQCIVFIDEIDAVGMRRASLGSGMSAPSSPYAAPVSPVAPSFYGANGAITASGDVIVESKAWREHVFAQRAEQVRAHQQLTTLARISGFADRYIGGMGMMGGGGQALQQLLVVMDGMGEPPVMKKFFTNRFNTFLDAMFVIPQRLGKLPLRLGSPKPRREELYFIGACNVPLNVLDPALTRPGRMGRHIWFTTPTKDDRKDIFELYLGKVAHEPDLDTDRRRDELARITSGWSPAMIEQCCSMALTIAHAENRRVFAWRDILEAMTTVEQGIAQNVEYGPEELRAIAIHEAGHAACSHVYSIEDLVSTRLSVRWRGDALGHHMSMERQEKYSHWRSFYIGRLITILGAMAAEHIFYGQNSQGVSGDVQSATAIAAQMAGVWAMGPDPVHMEAPAFELDGPPAQPGGALPIEKLSIAPEDDVRRAAMKRLARIGGTIMNRTSGGGGMEADPLGAILNDRAKYQTAATLIGQAYVTAYAFVLRNRGAIEEIAETVIIRREMYGDEVVRMLDDVGLVTPELDLYDERTWPAV